jgi:hypothetical protein
MDVFRYIGRLLYYMSDQRSEIGYFNKYIYKISIIVLGYQRLFDSNNELILNTTCEKDAQRIIDIEKDIEVVSHLITLFIIRARLNWKTEINNEESCKSSSISNLTRSRFAYRQTSILESINADRGSFGKIIGNTSSKSISRIGTLRTNKSKKLTYSFIKAEESKWKPILQNLIQKYEEGNLESLNDVDKGNEEILIELFNALNVHFSKEKSIKSEHRNFSFISSPSYISEIERINRRIGTLSLNQKSSVISNLPSIKSNTFASNIESKRQNSIEGLPNKSVQMDNSFDIFSSSQVSNQIKIERESDEASEMFSLLKKLTTIRNAKKSPLSTNSPFSGQKMKRVQFELGEVPSSSAADAESKTQNPFLLLHSLINNKKSPFKERLSRVQGQEANNENAKIDNCEAKALNIFIDGTEKQSSYHPIKKSSFRSAFKISRIPSVKVFEKNKSLNSLKKRDRMSIRKSPDGL